MSKVGVRLKLVSKIAEFSERYYKEILTERHFKEKHSVDIKRLHDDWWEAMKFFLSRALYQGRRDELSERVEKEVRKVLDYYFKDPSQREHNFDTLRRQNWRELRKKLEGRIGKGKVGRGRDIELVIDTLRFISQLPDKNIVNYSVRQIEDGKLEDLWRSLQYSKSKTGIRSVGEKTASFYLRDLVALLNLESKIHRGQECLQPIDTWVRKVCKMIGFEKEGRELRKSIVETCNSLGVSPIRFNMGAWYVGTHALNILLKLLEKN